MRNPSNDPLFRVFDHLKSSGKIKTYIAFGEAIGENKAGVNDLKMGRKKMGIDHLFKLKKSYPSVSLEFLLGFSDQMWVDKASSYAAEPPPSYNDQQELIQALRETIASKNETIDTLKKLLENK